MWGAFFGSLIGLLSGAFFSVYSFAFIVFSIGDYRSIPYAAIAVVMFLTVGYVVGKLSDLYRKTKIQEQTIEKDKQVIAKSLEEKELLLREIHHRVKNNLSIMANLIWLQSESATHPEAKSVLLETHSRVSGMLDIYDELYRTGSYKEIKTDAYFKNIREIYANEKVAIITEVEPLTIDSDTAVNLEIIVNELITNAIKYAFPDNKTGTVTVTLKHSEVDKAVLKVADDGRGLPDSFSVENSDSFGIDVIKALVEQLEGTFSFSSNGGTTVSIQFPITTSH
jgi:two-component sensor histidine kinase